MLNDHFPIQRVRVRVSSRTELIEDLNALGFPLGGETDGAIGLEHVGHPPIDKWDTKTDGWDTKTDGWVLRGLYLYAGAARKSSVRCELELVTAAARGDTTMARSRHAAKRIARHGG